MTTPPRARQGDHRTTDLSSRALLTLARPWEAIDPTSKKAIGTGAFNLVRRSAFDKTPGMEWLRMEVAEDIGVGLMMKRFGGKPGIALGRGLLSVESYSTFGDVLRGLEKNFFAQAAHFRVWRGVGILVAALVGSVAPFVEFLPAGVPWARNRSTTAVAAYVLACVIVTRAAGGGLRYLLLSLPVGDLFEPLQVIAEHGSLQAPLPSQPLTVLRPVPYRD